ncbi:MAG: TolC family protein, partial [Bacteroidales bacterium]|nr:TolC family protein [Bacteroidales bacterium]
VKAQTNPWTLNDCINYALSRNIDVQQANLSNQRNILYFKQAKASRFPSLNASANQNFNWNRIQNIDTEEYGNLTGSDNTGYSIGSSVSLFKGMEINNRIRQSELNMQSSRYSIETVKESIELNVLDAFLQVLYAKESVTNAEKQIEATTEQLQLAEERLNLGIISRSDYLQIKSELAGEKLTLANAKSQLAITRISLMQLMELPVNDSFAIMLPDLNEILNQHQQPVASDVYAKALAIKPQIKHAAMNRQSALLDEKIAKAGLLPDLSMNAGLGTTYSGSESEVGYFEQMNNKVSPYIGLTLTIPIYQNKQVKTNIGIAKIGIAEAELEEINTKNELRKEIEQATISVMVAQEQYEASMEEYSVALESMEVANEKYNLGLINSVDFIFEKTNLITSESQFLQSKYNLIFSYKVLDFYIGIPLSL